MPLHTNDFGNAPQGATRSAGAKRKASGLDYHGLDIGAYLDFEAVQKLVAEALAKVPKSRLPEDASDWTATIIIHPGETEGASWIMEHNPLIWAGFKLCELLGHLESLFATAKLVRVSAIA